ncbi:MAG TPA: sugar phosphate isomerase/epimerase family protein [Candidatus Limnocylindrales bacterium]|nr:sugar phosphate isomerase/epimerase family protein [Candidatus Limnocylindrales bacterium]
MTRRAALAALSAASALAQDARKAAGPPPRTTPALCLYSDQMMKVGYEEMGGILKMIGFDGVDLMVQPGGHITPEHADLDLERGIESMNGSGVNVYSVSTSITAPTDKTLQTAVSWAGQMGVPVFRPGDWKYGTGAEPEQRLAQVAREMQFFSQIGAQVGVAVAIHNGPVDSVGAALWDTQMVIRGLDPRTIGYAYDTGYGASQGPVALRLAASRLKMVVARDGYWSKEGGAWKFVECPLGEGMVDWQEVFAALRKAEFTGPVSLRVGYEPKDELNAIKKDLDFLKKHRASAFA